MSADSKEFINNASCSDYSQSRKRDSPTRIADKIILFVTDDYNTLISQAHTGLIQVGHSAYVLNRPEDEP